VEPEARAEFMLGDSAQFQLSRIQGVVNNADGVGPRSRTARVRVQAIGQTYYPNGDEITDTRIFFTVFPSNGTGTIQLADNNRVGIHIAVLDPATLERIMYETFLLFERPDRADALVEFIASIPAGLPVLVGTMGRSLDGASIDQRILDALASLGAQLNPDSLSNVDSYALIGGKGMPAVQSWVYGDSLRRAREVIPRYAVAATERLFLVQPGAGQLVTPTIGPATAWRTARIVTGGAGRLPDVTVFGVRRDGVRDSIGEWTSTATVDLSSVDILRYPRLELRTKFPLDSNVRVRSIEVDFDPSPELAVVPRSITVSRDSVLQGDAAELSLKVVNLSRRYLADNVAIAMAHRSNADTRVVATQQLTIAPLERKDVQFDLTTDRYGASNMLTVRLNPSDIPAEPYRHNNADTTYVRAGTDTSKPQLLFYADGQRIMDGDYVSPTARLEVRLFDNSRLRVVDTTAILMILDLNEITLDSGAVFSANPGGEALASYSYQVEEPGLADGEHTITFRGTDASGNRTIAEFIRFNVARGLRIVDAFNYPNPFRDNTEFTFRVGGASQPTSGEIAIYSVAGRRIKTITLSAVDIHLGFNHIEWDGRDADGDRLANGVYFYRLLVDSPDGRVETIEKLVVMQ
ncbi:MAG: hypothetical protein H7X80_06905, partial [bacterium]|nr:hypothetical protein [Candidatus Kapabacteria bacterium]